MKKSECIINPRKNNNQKRSELISVLLLAENHGYRMKSYGPISLVNVGNETLLEHQIHAISSAFVNFEIVLCSGFETTKIYNFIKNKFGPSIKIRIVENQVYYHSNCCESIRLCMNNVMTDKLIICGGGVLLTSSYLKSLDLKQSSIVFQDQDCDNLFDVGVIQTENNKLESLSLAVKDKCWTELMYLCGAQMIKSFYQVVSNPEFKNRFFFEAINGWNHRRNLNIYRNSSDPIIKINNIKTLKRINNYENLVR